MDRRKPELFRKRWGHTISSNPLRTILETYLRWRTGASLSCLSYLGFYLGLFLTQLLVFKFNSSSWLFQGAAEHYQVTFATGVKMRKVGSPLVCLCFSALIWHYKLFLRLSRTSQQYKPTPKKFKHGATLLFRGLMMENTQASSMRSRVSYRFQIDSW